MAGVSCPAPTLLPGASVAGGKCLRCPCCHHCLCQCPCLSCPCHHPIHPAWATVPAHPVPPSLPIPVSLPVTQGSSSLPVPLFLPCSGGTPLSEGCCRSQQGTPTHARHGRAARGSLSAISLRCWRCPVTPKAGTGDGGCTCEHPVQLTPHIGEHPTHESTLQL